MVFVGRIEPKARSDASGGVRLASAVPLCYGSPMNAILPIQMTVDEFLRWSERQEQGRYELENGRVIAMPAESYGHVTAKDQVTDALKAAVRRAAVPYFVLPDGMAVLIDGKRSYEPDAIVAELPRPLSRSLAIANPTIVVEVLSSGTVRRDLTEKVVGYAKVPSIEHYLVIDPDERLVLHFRRRGDVLLPPEEPLNEGTLRLDPPGLEVPVADMLGPAPAA